MRWLELAAGVLLASYAQRHAVEASTADRLVPLNNAGKRWIGFGHRISIVVAQPPWVPEAEEPHFTFVENALAKGPARGPAHQSPALADDLGLMRPCSRRRAGVHSALCRGTEIRRPQQRRNWPPISAGKRRPAPPIMSASSFVRHADDPQARSSPKANGTAGSSIDAARRRRLAAIPISVVGDRDSTAAELCSGGKNADVPPGQCPRQMVSRLEAAAGQ